MEKKYMFGMIRYASQGAISGLWVFGYLIYGRVGERRIYWPGIATE